LFTVMVGGIKRKGQWKKEKGNKKKMSRKKAKEKKEYFEAAVYVDRTHDLQILTGNEVDFSLTLSQLS
jgi:hypothetical protein